MLAMVLLQIHIQRLNVEDTDNQTDKFPVSQKGLSSVGEEKSKTKIASKL